MARRDALSTNIGFARRWLPAFVVVLAYAIVATWQIELPGVYMDAVNPDYLAVRVLNWHAGAIDARVLPGNYLLNYRLPILVSLYHGTQQFWLGLPFFWLFGMTVAGLRATHALFGLWILITLYWLLGRGGLRPWQCAVACTALALDPAYTYAFRTQSYITLAPAAWLMLSLGLLQGTQGAREPVSVKRWLVAGGCYGLSVVGYFVYAFYLPAIAMGLIMWAREPSQGKAAVAPRTRILAWSAGFALGMSFYVLGYTLLAIDQGGLRGLFSYLHRAQASLSAFASPADLGTRAVFAWHMVRSVALNTWHSALMFGEPQTFPGASWRLALLVGAPFALWLVAESRRSATVLLRVLVALPVAFVIVSLLFGTRLGGHHFMSLLPLGYAALALGVARCAAAFRAPLPQRNFVVLPFFVLPFVSLAVGSVIAQTQLAGKLAATGGVGLYSDAINRYAAQLNAAERKPFVYFPDWGLSLPIAFLTRGTVGIDGPVDASRARRLLCNGQDVAVVAIEGDRAVRFAAWQRDLQWSPPAIEHYRQRDGPEVFSVALFEGAKDNCTSKKLDPDLLPRQ